MSSIDLGNMTGPSRPGMSMYMFTDANGYRVGPRIEARNPEEARAKVESMTGVKPAHCQHLSDYHSMTPAPPLPDPEDMYDYLFPQECGCGCGN